MNYYGIGNFENELIKGRYDGSGVIIEDFDVLNEAYITTRELDYNLLYDVELNGQLNDFISVFYSWYFSNTEQLIISLDNKSLSTLVICELFGELRCAIVELSEERCTVPRVLDYKNFVTRSIKIEEMKFMESVIDGFCQKYDDDYMKEIEKLFYDLYDVNQYIESYNRLLKIEFFMSLHAEWKNYKKNILTEKYEVIVNDYSIKFNSNIYQEICVESAIEQWCDEFEIILDYFEDNHITNLIITSNYCNYNSFEDEIEDRCEYSLNITNDPMIRIVEGLALNSWILGGNFLFNSDSSEKDSNTERNIVIEYYSNSYELIRKDNSGKSFSNEIRVNVLNSLGGDIRFELYDRKFEQRKQYIGEVILCLPYWKYNDEILVKSTIGFKDELLVEVTHVDTLEKVEYKFNLKD